MWFLCVMRHTVLWGLLLVCLLVGHTHDEIDRLFSRIKVALAGHDYFTVIEMLEKLLLVFQDLSCTQVTYHTFGLGKT